MSSVQTPAARPNGRAVGDGDRLLLVLEGDDRQHRAEHLVLGDEAVRCDVGEDGRREEIAVGQAGGIGAFAAEDQLGAVGDGAVRPCPRPSRAGPCVATGPICVAGSSGSPILMPAARFDRISSTSSRILRWTRAREPATQVWPAAAKMPASSPASACFMSASGKTMLALLPPSSSVTVGQARGGARADGAAGLDAAGEGDLGDVGMVDQRLAGGAVAGDDVDHAGRDAGLLGEPRRLDHRGGRHLRRLDDHGVAGGQRRRHRHDGEEQRRVPRHDHADHAERLAEGIVEHRGAVERDDPALDLVGEAAVVIEPVRHDPGLEDHLVEELAVLRGLDAADLVGVRMDRVGPAHQQPAAPGRRDRPPFGERRLGRATASATSSACRRGRSRPRPRRSSGYRTGRSPPEDGARSRRRSSDHRWQRAGQRLPLAYATPKSKNICTFYKTCVRAGVKQGEKRCENRVLLRMPTFMRSWHAFTRPCWGIEVDTTGAALHIEKVKIIDLCARRVPGMKAA